MRLPTLLTVLLVSLSAALGAEMTHEETVVRMAYARLAYAAEIENVFTANATHSTPKPSMHFTLSNFSVGKLSDIAGASFIDRFPVNDSEEIIHTSVDTITWDEAGKSASMEALRVAWGPPPTTQDHRGPMFTYTVEKAIPIVEREWHISGLLTYCTFTVTASLGGRSRTYQAVFFFDKSGHAAPMDTVVGQDGNNLDYFLKHPVFPSVLLRNAKLSSDPAVNRFLATGPKRESCNTEDACCDLVSLQCGTGGNQ